MKTILIIGHQGLIGTQVKSFFESHVDNVNLISVDLNDNFDLLNRESMITFLKTHPNINYIVNCTGLNDHVQGKVSNLSEFETDIEFLDKFMDMNVKSVCWLIEDGYKFLPNINGIINFSSLYGIMSPYHPIYKTQKSLSYTLSKHALEGVIRYYSALFGGEGLRINSIRVGGIGTKDQPSKFKDWFESRTPLGRMAKVDDLFGVLELLCSEKSSYITGQSFAVDGGLTVW